MARTQFIRSTVIKRYVNGKGKRVAPSFLMALDAMVQRRIERAVAEHNGGKKTLDAQLLGAVAGDLLLKR